MAEVFELAEIAKRIIEEEEKAAGQALNWDGSPEIPTAQDDFTDPLDGLGQSGSYFDEHGTFIPKYLADELLTSFYIKTAASDLWTYKAGVHLPNGKHLVAAEAQRRLHTYTRTNRIKETLDYIERATYTELPEPNLDIINGKSVFLWIIDNLIGFQNVSHIPLQDLEENKFKVAGLLGKLVNTFADLDNRALKSTSLLKMLTSGDPLEAERKFKDPFSFRNYARMIFSANQIPRSSDTTFAFYERWIILPFAKVFDINNPATDRDLRGKLSTPQELSGIFNRALTGLKNLELLSSFTQPAAVRVALAEYMQSNDSVLAFCEECIEPGGFTSKPMLYSSYKLWCEQQGLKPVSQKKLKPSLLQVYPNIEESRDGRQGPRGWSGIRLNEEAPIMEDFSRW